MITDTHLGESRVLPIDEVQPYYRNPRRISDKAVEAVADSIERYGYQQPIVVDEENVVIVGHTRLQAAKKLGYTRVEVYVATGLSQEKVQEYRLIDNRVGEMTSWDHDSLVQELREFESKLLQDYFPEVDLEIGQIQSAINVTQKEVDRAVEAIQHVKEADPIMQTSVKCPSCYFEFKVRTDSLPGLSRADLIEMADGEPEIP